MNEAEAIEMEALEKRVATLEKAGKLQNKWNDALFSEVIMLHKTVGALVGYNFKEITNETSTE